MFKKFSFFIFSICTVFLFSQSSLFLNIVPAAKPASLGEAYTAIAEDIYGVFYNPAVAGKLTNRQAAVSYLTLYEGINYVYATYAHMLKNGSSITAQVGRIDYGEIEKYSGGQFEGTVSPYSMFLSVSYGKRLITKPNISIGFSSKFIQEKLENTATALAFDAGMVYDLKEKPWVIGISVLNVGSGIKFKNEKDNLPLTVRIGTGYRYKEQVKLSADISFSKNSIEECLGIEYCLTQFVIRAGYSTLSNISVGIGINLDRFALDFAYNTQGVKDLGEIFKISFCLKKL